MGDGTTISWTDATWNPIRGCRRTAPEGSKQSGCGDPSGGGCYAERQAARFCGKGQAYEGLITITASGPRWSGKTMVVGKHLADPIRWKKPRRIFVDSMSDLFYEGFTNEQIAAVFGVMAAAPQHTFQVLTKRAQRMREWFAWLDEHGHEVMAVEAATWLVNEAVPVKIVQTICGHAAWPLPNVWLGTSVENQAAADDRIPDLLRTPAAIRFLSCEPLIGPVDLTKIGMYGSVPMSSLAHVIGIGMDRPALDWIIAGCESGPRARPCNVDWLRSLRDQCAAARVPFFLKQAVLEGTAEEGEDGMHAGVRIGVGSHVKGGTNERSVCELPYLDGVQHAAFPEAHAANA